MLSKTFQGATGDFVVSVERNAAKDTNSHKAYTYSLVTPTGELLFGNKDTDYFGISIYTNFSEDEEYLLHTALDAATIEPGDTDEDYFEKYTEAELAFAKSYDCEYLQTNWYDFERGYCEL